MKWKGKTIIIYESERQNIKGKQKENSCKTKQAEAVVIFA